MRPWDILRDLLYLPGALFFEFFEVIVWAAGWGGWVLLAFCLLG